MSCLSATLTNAVFAYLYICICVFASQTPGNFVSEVLLPLPFQKYSTCHVYLQLWPMLYLRICVFVSLCLCICVFAIQTPRNIVSEVFLPNFFLCSLKYPNFAWNFLNLLKISQFCLKFLNLPKISYFCLKFPTLT